MSTTIAYPSLSFPHSESLSPPHQLHSDEQNTPATRPPLPRRSSSLHKQLLTRLRPLPLQYIFSMWLTKPTSLSPPATSTSVPTSTSVTPPPKPQSSYALTLLAASIPDIATFYRIFNNTPWPHIPLRSSIHFFRSSVRPLWEDPENVGGGCWVLEMRRDTGSASNCQHTSRPDSANQSENDRALLTFHELSLLTLGGMLQATATQHGDHVLGISFSPRLYFTRISIWTKRGKDERSIEALGRAVMEGLSADLRPNLGGKGRGRRAGRGGEEWYYRRHEECEGHGGRA